MRQTSLKWPYTPNHTATYQQGFTLIELMVSLVLGLLITAAAVQLFISSANGVRVQAAVTDIQDAAVFSMSYMKKEIAMANLGASTPMTQESAWTGVVLTGSIGTGVNPRTGNLRGVIFAPPATNASLTLDDLLTKSAYGPNNIKLPVKSDQLTIQYQAPFAGTDCEGNVVNQGDMVIERFFTRDDRQLAPDEKNLDGTANSLGIVLACDAGRYQKPQGTGAENITTNTAAITNFGDDGTILVNRVDDFEVQLGVQLANKKGISYVSIANYMAKTSGVYTVTAPIVAVQFGVITRGSSTVSGVTTTKFQVNGVERELKDTSKGYVRRVYQSMVSLRNHGVAND